MTDTSSHGPSQGFQRKESPDYNTVSPSSPISRAWNSHEVRLNDGASRLHTLDDLLSESRDVAISRVEGNDDNRLLDVRPEGTSAWVA